jgi:hypothetical protein
LLPNFWEAIDNIAAAGSMATTLRPWLIREPVAMPVPARLQSPLPPVSFTQFDDVVEQFDGVTGSIAVITDGARIELLRPLSWDAPELRHPSVFHEA